MDVTEPVIRILYNLHVLHVETATHLFQSPRYTACIAVLDRPTVMEVLHTSRSS